jgi:hypothetical protein
MMFPRHTGEPILYIDFIPSLSLENRVNSMPDNSNHEGSMRILLCQKLDSCKDEEEVDNCDMRRNMEL